MDNKRNQYNFIINHANFTRVQCFILSYIMYYIRNKEFF